MSSVVISGDTSGAITLSAPAVAGTNTITLPASTGTVMVNGPSFCAVTNTTQSNLVINTQVKLTVFGTVRWDTNSNFNSTTCRFTPTVAGYYQVNGGIQANGNLTNASSINLYLYKNGANHVRTNPYVPANPSYPSINLTGLVYMNGSTDYLELYVEIGGSSGTFGTYNDPSFGYFSASMVRSA
jgi:hypothetical protein